MQLTDAQIRKGLGGAVVYFAALSIGTSIAGRYIAKKNDVLIKNCDNMREVGLGLGKIASYQQVLIEKHLMVLDEFDRVVFEDLSNELEEKLKAVGYLKETTEENDEE
jgi:hypothetical protein